MEIVRVISVKPAEGKSEEAIKVLTKLLKYVNQAYTKYIVRPNEIGMDLDGGQGRLHWIERFASFAAFEESQKVWESDPRSKEFATEWSGLTGAAETHFYRILA